MHKQKNKINIFFDIALIALFLLMITVPMFGLFLGFETSASESENRELAKLPVPDFDNFSIKAYTNDLDLYINDHFGFRSDLVRWNQLMHIKWFNTAPITSVVINENEVQDDKLAVITDTQIKVTNENSTTEELEVKEPIVKGEATEVETGLKPTEKTVAIQGDVIVGQDGWYYYAKEQIIDDYRGVIPLTDNQLSEIKNKLVEKRDWLKEQGIDFYILISPNKSSIYPEYLPETINKVNDQTRFDQVVGYLRDKTDLKIIDPRPALLKAKNDNLVYEITGTHWNEYGGFIAYQELIRAISQQFTSIIPLNIDDFMVEEQTAGGSDLAIMLSIQSYVQDTLINLKPKTPPLATDDKFLFDDPNPNPAMPLVAKKVDNPELPKALIFRDSFMKRLVPFLSENFSRSSYVWTYEMIPEIIEVEKPDIVIYEFVERKIEEVLLEIL